MAEVRMLTCVPAGKDTEAFVIAAIAKSFAEHLDAAEKMVMKLEGKSPDADDSQEQ